MFKSNKAITLIALIITIIVLLILAAVTINMVLGDNGLFNKAKTSVGKYENAQEKENSVLAGYEAEITSYRDYEAEISALKERIKELENENNYSTEEKVVGKWTNKKPIYKKTIETGVTSTITKNSWTTIATDTALKDVEQLIKTEVTRGLSSDPRTENHQTIKILRSTGEVQIYTEVIYQYPSVVTLYYTKTTDSIPTT